MARTIAEPTPSFFPDVAPGGPQDIPGGGYQRIEATPASFGGLIGAAEEQAGARVGAGGEALIGAGIQRQDLYNQIAGDQATTEYMTGVHKKMFGDPTAPEGDPARVGLLGMDGPGAMTAARAMPGQLDQLREQIASQLPNDYVRQLFNSETRRQRIYIDQQIGAHYQTQMDKWGRQVQDDRIKSAATGAGLNYSDPEQLRQNYTTITDAAVKQVEHDIGGKIDAANPDHQARLHIALAGGYSIFAKNIVDAALAHNQPEVADKLLQDWAPWLGLPGPVQEELHRSIREPLIRSEGEAAANAAISGRPYSGPGGGGAAPGAFRAPPGPRFFNAPVEGANPAEQQMLNEIRYREPDARDASAYTEVNRQSGAGGAYQFKDQTWQENAQHAGFGTQYARAVDAPPKVQDAVALWTLRNRGTVPWAASGPYPALGGEGGLQADFAKRSGTFGTPEQAAQHLTTVTAPGGASFQVHSLAAPQIQGFVNELEGMGYRINPAESSGYNNRNKVGVDTNEKSEHAYGTAIDINSDRNKQGPNLVTDLPSNISQIAAKWGLKWGGDFEGTKDAMHFEVARLLPGGRPEVRVAAATPTIFTDVPPGTSPAPAPAPAGVTPLSEATKATLAAGGMSPEEIARVEAASSPGTPVPSSAGAAAPTAVPAAPVAAPAAPAPGAVPAAPAQAPTPAAPAPAIPPLTPIIQEHQRALDALKNMTFSTPEAEDRARQRVNEHYHMLEEMNRAQTGDEERQRVLTEKDRLDRERKAADDIVSRLLDDPTKVPASDISHSPDLTTPGMKENLHELQKKRLHEIANPEEIKDYGPAFHDLWTRVHAPAGDPSRITDPQVIYEHAKVGGDLGVAGADFLVKDIFGRRTEQGENEQTLRNHFMIMARNKITGTNEGMHLRDPKGDDLYQRFLGYFLPAYEQARRGTDKEPGKTPEQLLTPGSPDYLGAVLDQPGNAYVRPMDQWFKDAIYDSPPATSLAAGDLASPDALKAAVAKNPALRDQAILEARKRGWIAGAPAPAPAPPIVH